METKLKKLAAHLKELHVEELEQVHGGDDGDSQGCDARDSSAWDRLFSPPADCRDSSMPQDNGDWGGDW